MILVADPTPEGTARPWECPRCSSSFVARRWCRRCATATRSWPGAAGGPSGRVTWSSAGSGRRPDLLVVKRAVRPEGSGWWLEGDNGLVTDDSRVYGVADVEARVILRYWPHPRLL